MIGPVVDFLHESFNLSPKKSYGFEKIQRSPQRLIKQWYTDSLSQQTMDVFKNYSPEQNTTI